MSKINGSFEMCFDGTNGVIYFLYFNGSLQYVGKSKSVLNRLSSHSVSKEFQKVSILEVPIDMIDEYEKAFIKCLKPKQNKVLLGDPTDFDKELVEKYIDKRTYFLAGLDEVPQAYESTVAFYFNEGEDEIDNWDDPDPSSKIEFGFLDDITCVEEDEHESDCEYLCSVNEIEVLKKYNRDEYEKILESLYEKCDCPGDGHVYIKGRSGCYVAKIYDLRVLKENIKYGDLNAEIKDADFSMLESFGINKENLFTQVDV